MKQAAKQALRKSTNKEVKAFAEDMVRDHDREQAGAGPGQEIQSHTRRQRHEPQSFESRRCLLIDLSKLKGGDARWFASNWLPIIESSR